MSRIGNAIITVPKEATVTRVNDTMVVKGPKGELRLVVPAGITVKMEADKISISRAHHEKADRALHGFVRAQLSNMITGVTKSWSRILELSGVGYRASMNGTGMTLNLGFSHPIEVTPPAGIQFATAEGKITVTGADKQLVGQVAAKIRALKEPEPYKGKGIKYQGEYIRKKAGKAAKAVGGAPGAK